MALVRRISRLFAADMHAILDQLEEPEAVLRQAVREMEEELARQQQRSKWLEAEIESACRRRATLAKTEAELDRKLDIAFENGDDELARRLTRRKLETARLVEHVEAKRASLEDSLAEQETLVAANQDRLEGTRQKADLLGAGAADASGAGSWREATPGIDDDDIELAFLREKQARSRA